MADAPAGRAGGLRDRDRRGALGARAASTIAFDHVGLDRGEYVEIDPRFMRPAEVDHLIGDYDEGASEQLGWEPRTSFEELIRLMVDADLELLAR